MGSTFPKDRYEMKRARYVLKSTRPCTRCGAAIEWWKTTNGKLMPFNPMDNDHTVPVPHRATCPQADDFRNPNPEEHGTILSDPNHLQRAVSDLLSRTGARTVVLIHEKGHAAAWRNGIPAEDLRHELITAANQIRNTISKGDSQ